MDEEQGRGGAPKRARPRERPRARPRARDRHGDALAGEQRGGFPGGRRDRRTGGQNDGRPGEHTGEQHGEQHREQDPDARWLAGVMHAAFFLLLGASLARYLLRHPWEFRSPWIIGLSVALAVLYTVGPVFGPRATPAG